MAWLHAALKAVKTVLIMTMSMSMQARIKAAGGRVVYNSGSHRVMGMLAMTRAIGDHFLRPYVIAEPEVSGILLMSAQSMSKPAHLCRWCASQSSPWCQVKDAVADFCTPRNHLAVGFVF